jgi:16S rRNA pseudouridine516 synthase
MKLVEKLSKHRSLGRQQAQRLIAAGCVQVDGCLCQYPAFEIDGFSGVFLDSGECVQAPQRALYLMLHKPAGTVSATTDAQHQTALDWIQDPDKHTLHIAGRLDRFTTGLLLLTNDGRWSKRLMAATAHVPKRYLVETHQPIPDHAPQAFRDGFYFPKEGRRTLPAELEILAPNQARICLHEGLHHQIKRMLGQLGCWVKTLHRESIGQLQLPDHLSPGNWQPLNEQERVDALQSNE